MNSAHELQAALPQLSIFLAVARHSSFSGAAREFGISTSAVSQAVRQLEGTLKLVLLRRTTRAVTPTAEGTRLIEHAAGPVKRALEALGTATAKPGEVVGSVKLCASPTVLQWLLNPVVPVFRARYPQISLEIVVQDRVFNLVTEGFDGAFEVTEVIERDMVRVRLTDPFRFYVAGAPAYFAKHGKPKKPDDLLQHECLTFRWPSGDALYAWEFQRGRRTWRVPVRGGLVTNSYAFCEAMAEQGVGLLYGPDRAIEPLVREGRLEAALERYAATEPGLFLCYPSRTQRTPAFQLFIETAKEVLRRP